VTQLGLIGRRTLAIALALLASSAQAEPRRSRQERIKLKERSGLSAMGEQRKRLGWAKLDPKKESDYALADESFMLYTPRRKHRKAPGLFVWVSPGMTGVLPPFWEKSFEKYNLIAIGADNSGSERSLPTRIGLALDAVHGVQSRQAIDPERIYVGGFSSGAQVACFLAFHYPELFRGVLLLGGVDFYRNVPVPGKRLLWRGRIPAPSKERIALAVRRTRFYMLSGEKDAESRVQMEVVAGIMRKEDGYLYAKFREMKGLAHVVPGRSWFERAVKFFDHPPLPKPRAEPGAAKKPAAPSDD